VATVMVKVVVVVVVVVVAVVVVVMLTLFKFLSKPMGNLTDLKQHGGTKTPQSFQSVLEDNSK
jgi:hypothetical protein